MLTVIFDTETTGLPKNAAVPLSRQPKIIEFGAVLVDEQYNVLDSINQLINPGEEITEEITKITGITNEDLVGKPVFAEVEAQIRAFFERAQLMIAHNLPFDRKLVSFDLQRCGKIEGFPWPQYALCTAAESQIETGKRQKLTQVYLEVTGQPLAQTHRALDDVMALLEIVKGKNYVSIFTAAQTQN